jgi:hypothetical protein
MEEVGMLVCDRQLLGSSYGRSGVEEACGENMWLESAMTWGPRPHLRCPVQWCDLVFAERIVQLASTSARPAWLHISTTVTVQAVGTVAVTRR